MIIHFSGYNLYFNEGLYQQMYPSELSKHRILLVLCCYFCLYQTSAYPEIITTIVLFQHCLTQILLARVFFSSKTYVTSETSILSVQGILFCISSFMENTFTDNVSQYMHACTHARTNTHTSVEHTGRYFLESLLLANGPVHLSFTRDNK